jgi:hypothetical protein
MQTPQSWRASLGLESSDAARTRGEVSAAYGRDVDGGLEFELGTSLTFQPSARLQVTVGPEYEREVTTQQYVTTRAGGPAATYGSRYIFAHVDRSTYATEIRLNYTFKPDLTLDLYAEPFAASGRFDHYGELARRAAREMRRYGLADGTTLEVLDDGSHLVTDGADTFVLRNRDFNVRSFRSNVVLRWEWRPGSTLYLVWQQDRSEEDVLGRRSTLRDMLSSPGSTGDHFFVVKATYWFSAD